MLPNTDKKFSQLSSLVEFPPKVKEFPKLNPLDASDFEVVSAKLNPPDPEESFVLLLKLNPLSLKLNSPNPCKSGNFK